MTTAPTAMLTPDRQLVQRDKTYSDFLLAVEEFPQFRIEFIEGVIWMTPAPVPFHQILVHNLMLLVGGFIHRYKLGILLSAPIDVELTPGERIVQPDLIFIAQEHMAERIGEKRITGVPDLVIEILSPATAHADRHIKLPLYARCGVPEYWIIDPDSTAVEVYLLDRESYRVAGIFVEGETISVGRFADAAITVDAIFAG